MESGSCAMRRGGSRPISPRSRSAWCGVGHAIKRVNELVCRFLLDFALILVPAACLSYGARKLLHPRARRRFCLLVPRHRQGEWLRTIARAQSLRGLCIVFPGTPSDEALREGGGIQGYYERSTAASYFEDDCSDKDEAQRIAANIAKLPELVRK